jgi:actin-related protein 10
MSSFSNSVVLELGARHTRVGFAGEATCRFTVESGDDLQRALLRASGSPEARRSALQEAVVALLERITLKLLHISATEQRQFVVVLPVFAAAALKQEVACSLFARWGAQSVSFLRSELVALLPLRRESALLVDSGFAETRLVPVVLRTVLESAVRTTPAASARADALLLETLRPLAPATAPQRLAAAAEHARLSHVHLNAVDARTSDTVSVSIDGTSVAVPRRAVNAAALDVLGTDDDDRPLAALVVDALLACPIDARAVLAHNICAVGGGACAQGFAGALGKLVGDELRARSTPEATALVAHVCVSSHATIPASLIAWVGASLSVAAGEHSPDSMTREQFEKQNRKWPDV